MAMLSSVSGSQRAVQVNVAIMRTFVRLREMLSSREELRRKIDAMEKRYDARFQAVFETIRQMLATPIPAKNPIGFHAALELQTKPGKSGGNNVNNRKQISYLPQGQLFGLEKTGHFGYTFVVVDSQKIPTNRHVHQGIQA
jgi:hypothetical protein